jgi:putative ABC transport system permease protein
VLSYSLRELLRNPRRTLASVSGVMLGVGLFTSISFFVDASAATMTSRAIAPVPVDMGAALTSPLASTNTLKETVPAGALASGQTVTVTLMATNIGKRPATALVVKDEAPAPLAYVPGSTALEGRPVLDGEQSPLADGVAIPTLAPGGSVTVTYLARATAAVPVTQALAFHGTVVSREDPVPSEANAARPVRLDDLQAEIGRLRGVGHADRLAIFDLPAGSLRGSGPPLGAPIRVFAFDQSYLAHHPAVTMSGGAFIPGSAVLSVEASRALAAAVGATVNLSLPGRGAPVALGVSGVADLSRAASLFASRNPDRPGDFIYVPNSIVVSPELFEDLVLPPLRIDAGAASPALKTPPLLGVDVHIDRSQLSADPASALIRTQGWRRSIERIAPGQVVVVDNLSRALTVARSDAVIAKILFLFLGLPGVLLAAFLSAYAGSMLARAQRREHAVLRSRGAQPAHLRRLLAYNTLGVSSLGALFGLGLGIATLIVVFGAEALSRAAPRDLQISALLAVAAGVLATALALYLPGHRALSQEISVESREMATIATPFWLRLRLDLVLLAAAAVVELVLYLAGGFTPTQVEGQSVSLSFYLLLAPLLTWLGATLLMTRLFLLLAPYTPAPSGARFGSPVLATLRRSIKRRAAGVASGIVVLGLAVALGTNVAVFTSTYEAERAADARFVVGADMRVTPSALSQQPSGFASQLQVPGVTALAPLVFHTANAALGADRKGLAAVDASSLERTVQLPDSFFLDGSGAAAMAALKADPAAVLVDWELARDFNIQTGDSVKIQLEGLGGREVTANLHAAGRFRHFPGFPQHVDLVTNLAYYQAITGLATVDFFLLRVADASEAGLKRTADLLTSGPGSAIPLRIDSIANVSSRDQSTLAALNLRGLGGLDSLYTVLMSVAGVGMFVFGLLLQRRKEYVTLRALGIRMRQLQAIVVGESALVAVGGLLIGSIAGTVMAYMFVQILRPIFVLPPERLTFPLGLLGTLAALVMGGSVLSALAASALVRRLNPIELLREE